MTELNLTQLLYLIELLLEQQPERSIPLIQRSNQKPLTFWLSGIGTPPPRNTNPEVQKLDDLIAKLRLLPWHAERDFSNDTIVYLRGDVTELEQNIGQIFELEHGVRPGFTLAARLLGQIQGIEQYACLLYLNGLHTYLPFVNWRNNPRCVIYYRHIPSKQSETDGWFAGESRTGGRNTGGVYVQWGYELPADLPGLDRYYQLNNRLILLGQKPSDSYILADAHFFPLLDLFKLNVEAVPDLPVFTPQPQALPNLQLNIGPLCDPHIEAHQPLSKSPLMKFNMTLRSGYDSKEQFDADENTLQEQIEYLELQLEKVRLDKETQRLPASTLYVYEELQDHPYADGLDSLRHFIVRQPEWHLKNFEYQHLELHLISGKRSFHLVRQVQDNQPTPDCFNPPASSYQFYRERQWSDAIGCNIYLPMDNAGRTMEFYPALLPTRKEMAEKFKPALLGGKDPTGNTLLLWPDPWPDGQTIKTMLRIVLSGWENLREAQQFINIRAIQDATRTFCNPPVPADIARNLLYRNPLPSDPLQPQTEQQAINEVRSAWKKWKEEIGKFISEGRQTLNQAAEVEARVTQLKDLIDRIGALRHQKQKYWEDFTAAVQAMDEEFLAYPETVGKPFQDILNEQQDSEAKLEQLVKDFKLKVGPNSEYRAQAASRLRQLADDLAPLNPQDGE